MDLTAEDKKAVETLKQLAQEHTIDIAGAKIRRTSSRFCLGVEHGDYNGTELFGVGTDRFIWMAYKPSGSKKCRFFSGNFLDDGVIEFELDNVPEPKSAEVADTWGRFPYGVAYILKQESIKLTQGIDAVVYGNIPGGGMSRSASLSLNLILSLLDANNIEIEEQMKIVDLAQAVENDYIGSPCGQLDQIMILYTHLVDSDDPDVVREEQQETFADLWPPSVRGFDEYVTDSAAVGSIDAIEAMLHEYRELGFDQVILAPADHDADGLHRQMDLLTDRLLPAVS